MGGLGRVGNKGQKVEEVGLFPVGPEVNLTKPGPSRQRSGDRNALYPRPGLVRG